jgi:hypothetical protein
MLQMAMFQVYVLNVSSVWGIWCNSFIECCNSRFGCRFGGNLNPRWSSCYGSLLWQRWRLQTREQRLGTGCRSGLAGMWSGMGASAAHRAGWDMDLLAARVECRCRKLYLDLCWFSSCLPQLPGCLPQLPVDGLCCFGCALGFRGSGEWLVEWEWDVWFAGWICFLRLGYFLLSSVSLVVISGAGRTRGCSLATRPLPTLGYARRSRCNNFWEN